MEIKVNDTILLGVDMNSIDALFQESLNNLPAEEAATLMDILMKLLKTRAHQVDKTRSCFHHIFLVFCGKS